MKTVTSARSMELAERSPHFEHLSLPLFFSYHILIRDLSRIQIARVSVIVDVDYLQEYFRKEQLKEHLVSRAIIRSNVGGQVARDRLLRSV